VRSLERLLSPRGPVKETLGLARRREQLGPVPQLFRPLQEFFALAERPVVGAVEKQGRRAVLAQMQRRPNSVAQCLIISDALQHLRTEPKNGVEQDQRTRLGRNLGILALGVQTGAGRTGTAFA